MLSNRREFSLLILYYDANICSLALYVTLTEAAASSEIRPATAPVAVLITVTVLESQLVM